MEVDVGNNFFQSYEDLEVHKLMLSDRQRNKAYQEAVACNSNEIKGKSVLDVGAGTGILSVLFAQAGARIVYAVEASNTYCICEEVVRENGFEGVVKVIHSRVEDLTEKDIPEKVDIIVSEWMGFYLFHEGMLESVIAARDKFLKPDGSMFPETATLYSSPCRIPYMYKNWEDVNGVSMTSFGARLRENACKKPLTEVISSENILCDPEVITWIDLRDVSPQDIREFNLRHIAVAQSDSNYEGICLWFSCAFPVMGPLNPSEPIVLSTEPGEPTTHWKQTVIVLPQSIPVEKGVPICYDITLKQQVDNHRRFTIEVEMLDPETTEHPEYCDCYLTKCILRKELLKKYSVRSD